MSGLKCCLEPVLIVIRLTQLNVHSSVVWRFIATQDNSQRPMNRATIVSSQAPVLFRRERRAVFPTEVRKSYLELIEGCA